jgi:outer membrane protein TolC
VELHRAHEAEWHTLASLRTAWLEWSNAQERVALTQQYLKQLDEAVRIAGQQRKFGKIGSTAERALLIERATQQGELAAMAATTRQRELAVKALLGLSPEANVQLAPSLITTTSSTNAASSSADASALLSHPRLILAAAEYEVAEHALRLAIRKQFPDLKLGPASEWDEGNWKAGLTLSVPIPVLNGNRREIAEMRAARDAALATLETEYETLIHETAAARLQVDAAREQRSHLATVVAPLVDQQITDLNKQAALGELDVLLTLDALTRSHETKHAALQAQLDEAHAATRLRSLIVPPLRTPILQDLSKQEPAR